MLVVQSLAYRFRCSIDIGGEISHPRYGFDDDCVMGSGCRVRTPGKRCMVGHQHRGDRCIVQLLERPDYRMPGVLFIVSGNLAVLHHCRYRDGTIKVVGVGSAETWNRLTSLRPGRSVL